jgi:hypothetical protein
MKNLFLPARNALSGHNCRGSLSKVVLTFKLIRAPKALWLIDNLKPAFCVPAGQKKELGSKLSFGYVELK